MNNIIYLVVSLPRSGTTTLCEMAKICGLNPSHVLKQDFSIALEKYNFFADTPFYSPEYLLAICQIYKNIKFIYIDRDIVEVKNSMQKANIHNYLKNFLHKKIEINDKVILQDALCWNYIHKNHEINHKQLIINLSNTYSIPMLIYNFKDGWEPFCNFINSKIPQSNIPHLNKWQDYRYSPS